MRRAGARIVHHGIASASGNDRPIWLLIDSEAAGPGGPGRLVREEVERGRCRGIDKPPSFIRRCSLVCAHLCLRPFVRYPMDETCIIVSDTTDDTDTRAL